MGESEPKPLTDEERKRLVAACQPKFVDGEPAPANPPAWMLTRALEAEAYWMMKHSSLACDCFLTPSELTRKLFLSPSEN